MKHPGSMPYGASYGYSVVMGVGATAAAAEDVVRRALADPTNVAETRQPSSLAVTPMPASERITIESEDGLRTMELLDLTGRVLVNMRGDGSVRADLDVSGVPRGVHVLRCVTGAGAYSRIIVLTP
jgi:hypothetical protein